VGAGEKKRLQAPAGPPQQMFPRQPGFRGGTVLRWSEVREVRDAQRVFVGKETDRSAAIMLADADGHPRLRLRVEAAGQASIEFLDRDGKVTERIPAR